MPHRGRKDEKVGYRSSSLLDTVLGGRTLRTNRLMEGIKGNRLVARVPSDIQVEEYNSVLGLGRITIPALGVAAPAVNAPRDMVVRRMHLNCDEGLQPLMEIGVTAITIEGHAILQGGAVGGSTYSHDAVGSPRIDIPVAGGTPIAVGLVNNGAAARNITPSFDID